MATVLDCAWSQDVSHNTYKVYVYILAHGIYTYAYIYAYAHKNTNTYIYMYAYMFTPVSAYVHTCDRDRGERGRRVGRAQSNHLHPIYL